MPDEYATRREVDLLRADVKDTRNMVETLKSGDANVAVLSSQLTSLARDLIDLKGDINQRFSEHERVHEVDKRDRVSGRRWMITTCIAGLAILAGLYGWIALLLNK